MSPRPIRVAHLVATAGRSGVDSNCSIDPFSHSRAMHNDVSSDAMIMSTTAIKPGIRKLRDFRSSLYQTRTCASTGIVSFRGASRSSDHAVISACA